MLSGYRTIQTADLSSITVIFAKNLRESTADIRMIKAYLRETLCNAPATCGSFYRAIVNHVFHDSG